MAHCPDQHIHSAPWTKTSTATGLFRQIRAASSLESSRPSTTQRIPSRAASSTPARVWTVICVEPWRGRSGTAFRARAASPRAF